MAEPPEWVPPEPAPPEWGAPSPPGWGAPPPGWGAPPPPPPPPGWGWPPPPPVGPKGGSARTGPLPLHPMSVGDILDGAFKLLKANARILVTIVAVFVVPLQLAGAYARRDAIGNGFSGIFNNPGSVSASSSNQSGGSIAIQVVAALVNILVLPFLAGAVSQVVAASYLGQELGPGPALRRTGRRWLALLGGWFIVHLAESLTLLVGVGVTVLGAATSNVALVVLGVLLCIGSLVPFFAVLGLSVMVAPAIVVEDLGPVRGVRRSWRLARRRFFPVLGIALLAGVMVNILGSVLGAVPSVVALVLGGRFAWLIVAAGSIVTALVTQPILAIVATLQYFDARIRTEGFDLQVIADELASPGDHR